jgi:hypothetical protein
MHRYAVSALLCVAMVGGTGATVVAAPPVPVDVIIESFCPCSATWEYVADFPQICSFSTEFCSELYQVAPSPLGWSFAAIWHHPLGRWRRKTERTHHWR